MAGNVVYWEAAGAAEHRLLARQDTLAKGIASAALAQFLTKIEARPVYAHVAKHDSLRYVSYKNADSNLHERIGAMAMMAKNLLWSCAPIVAPRPTINPQRPNPYEGCQR